jgi:demethyllactenocin mycarosyltransferase
MASSSGAADVSDPPEMRGCYLGYVFQIVARIALVNAPFRSHVAAMHRLAEVLARQSHELVVWAPAEWRRDVERLGARLEPSSPEIPRTDGSGLAADFVEMTEREAERLISRLHDHDVDLLIRDAQTPWALVAGEYLGIPRIVSHPMFPMIDAGAPEASVPSVPSAPDGGDRERFERSWLSIARRWGVELTDVRGLYHRTSEPTLTFTTEEIVGDQLPPPWQCIGPLLPPPPRAEPARDRPLVYVSFGTAQNRRTELFRIVIDAATRLPVQVLISAGGRSFTPDELGPLPSNVTVREFVPVPEVLASASIQITHGGCNSVHESLVAGTPMVCLPQAFDQFPLSERVVELGVGVIAEESPDALAGAISKLLADDQARVRVRALSERLQLFDGDARVAAAIAASV